MADNSAALLRPGCWVRYVLRQEVGRTDVQANPRKRIVDRDCDCTLPHHSRL
jgi:hypothetical protein